MAGILITNYDTSKIFVWNNRFQKVTYTNSTGSSIDLPIGRLMGRIASSQKALPHVSTATDGSEQPMFVLADAYTVANGATVTLTVCDAGDVAEEKLVLGGSDTLSTIVTRTYTDSGTDTVAIASGSIRDLIARNTLIKLVPSTNTTGYDNQ